MFKDNRINDRDMYATEKTDYEMHKETKMMHTDGMAMGCGCPPMMGTVCPVIECPQERIVNRHIIHQVPHIVPINTRVINHHVYKHSYHPNFTSCEENVCTNVVEPGCGY